MNFFSSIFGGDKYQPVISGKYNYHVDTVIRGTLPYSTATIGISAYDCEDEDVRRLIQIKCKWYRLIEGRHYEIDDNDDTVYHVNPFDIGVIIKVVVTSLNNQFTGKASLEFGPIKMDISHREQIGEIVCSNYGQFKVKIAKIDGKRAEEGNQFENNLVVTKSEIMIFFSKQLQETQSEVRYTFDREIGFNITCDQHDPKALELLLDYHDVEKVYSIQFENRSTRDVFIESLRGMRCLRLMNISDMINNFGKILSREWLPKGFSVEDMQGYRTNYLVDSEKYKVALKDTITVNKQCSAENDKLMELIELLENDLKFGVGEFTSLLSNLKKKGEVDFTKYDKSDKEIEGESSLLLGKIKKDLNSSFNIKKANKESNVHGKRLLENERLAKLERDIDSSGKLNQMLKTEIVKLKPDWSESKKNKGEIFAPVSRNPFLDDEDEDEFKPRESFLEGLGMKEDGLGLSKNYSNLPQGLAPVSMKKNNKPAEECFSDTKLETDEMSKLIKNFGHIEYEKTLNENMVKLERFNKGIKDDTSRADEKILEQYPQSDDELITRVYRIFKENESMYEILAKLALQTSEAEAGNGTYVSSKIMKVLKKEIKDMATLLSGEEQFKLEIRKKIEKEVEDIEKLNKTVNAIQEARRNIQENNDHVIDVSSQVQKYKEENILLKKQLEDILSIKKPLSDQSSKIKQLESEIVRLKNIFFEKKEKINTHQEIAHETKVEASPIKEQNVEEEKIGAGRNESIENLNTEKDGDQEKKEIVVEKKEENQDGPKEKGQPNDDKEDKEAVKDEKRPANTEAIQNESETLKDNKETPKIEIEGPKDENQTESKEEKTEEVKERVETDKEIK